MELLLINGFFPHAVYAKRLFQQMKLISENEMSALVEVRSSLSKGTVELESTKVDVIFGHQLHKLPKG
jgi:hypothetical protein